MIDVLVERAGFLASLEGLLAAGAVREDRGPPCLRRAAQAAGTDPVAGDAEAAAAVHREAHGLVADEIYPVAEGA